MVWVKLDDRFATHPKVVSLSDRAFRLHVEAMCYCGMYETGGRVNVDSLHPSRVDTVSELVAAKLWDKTKKGYRIHDWTTFNPTKAQLDEKRRAEREKKRKWRESRRESTGDGPSDPPRARVPAPAPAPGVPSKDGDAGGSRPSDPTGSGAAPSEAVLDRIRACGCGDHHIDQYVKPLPAHLVDRLARDLEDAVDELDVDPENGQVGAWVFRRVAQLRKEA